MKTKIAIALVLIASVLSMSACVEEEIQPKQPANLQVDTQDDNFHLVNSKLDDFKEY